MSLTSPEAKRGDMFSDAAIVRYKQHINHQHPATIKINNYGYPSFSSIRLSYQQLSRDHATPESGQNKIMLNEEKYSMYGTYWNIPKMQWRHVIPEFIIVYFQQRKVTFMSYSDNLQHKLIIHTATQKKYVSIACRLYSLLSFIIPTTANAIWCSNMTFYTIIFHGLSVHCHWEENINKK